MFAADAELQAAARRAAALGREFHEFANAVAKAREDQIVVDLVRLPLDGSRLRADYRGICW